MTLTLTPIKLPLIRRDENLADIIVTGLRESGIDLSAGDILVVTSKIVSKAEGRMVDLDSVSPGERAIELAKKTDKDARLVELMLQESNQVLRAQNGTIIVEHRLGFVCANAGIDHSNVNPSPESPPQMSTFGEGQGVGHVLLLPSNPDASASGIRQWVESKTGKKIGVMIVDSHGRAWRIGTVGMCIGLSGIPGVIDERGWKDLFGYELRVTVVGVADELAAAASLVMGQAAEGTPVVHVRGFPYPLREGSLKELLRPKDLDLFR